MKKEHQVGRDSVLCVVPFASSFNASDSASPSWITAKLAVRNHLPDCVLPCLIAYRIFTDYFNITPFNHHSRVGILNWGFLCQKPRLFALAHSCFVSCFLPILIANRHTSFFALSQAIARPLKNGARANVAIRAEPWC